MANRINRRYDQSNSGSVRQWYYYWSHIFRYNNYLDIRNHREPAYILSTVPWKDMYLNPYANYGRLVKLGGLTLG